MMTVLSILLASLLLSVSAGIAATTYVNILTQPGMVLDFWARWIYKLRDKYVGTTLDEFNEGDEGQERADYYAIRHERADYIMKPILTCVYCVGGQLGLWLSVYYQLSFTTTFYVIPCLLTAFMSVWFGGAFQYIQQKYFPL